MGNWLGPLDWRGNTPNGMGLRGDATLSLGSDYLDQILGAGGLDYALFDFRKTDRLFQEAVGPTPADDNGELIGLGIGAEKQGSKTLAAVMAGQAELRGNGAPALGGSATAATYSTSTGVGAVTRVDASNQSAVQFAVVTGALYEIDIEATSANGVLVRSGSNPTGSVVDAAVAGANRQKFYVRPTNTLLFVAATSNGQTCPFTVYSLRRVPTHYAVQTGSGSLKPQLQAKGAQFDGSDDNLLTDWLMQVGANCIVAQFDVPATIPASQTIAGQDGAGRLSLYVTTTGVIAARIPDAGTLSVAGDMRGQTVIACLSVSGTQARLQVNALAPVTLAYSTPITTNLASRIGALNAGNNTASGFSAATIRRCALGLKDVSPAEFQQISSQWLAAA